MAAVVRADPPQQCFRAERFGGRQRDPQGPESIKERLEPDAPFPPQCQINHVAGASLL